MNWVTKITQCVDQKYFVDKQCFGPYKFWHHEHHFEGIEEGVLMKNILHYAILFWILEKIMGDVFILKKTWNTFSYRGLKLNEIFRPNLILAHN